MADLFYFKTGNTSEDKADKSSNLFVSDSGNLDRYVSPYKSVTQPEKDLFVRGLLQSILESDFSDMESSLADKWTQEHFLKYGPVVIDCINDTLLRNLNKSGIVTGILRIISQLTPEQLGSFGRTMAAMVIMYNNTYLKSDEVAEAVIRCMELWQDRELSKILSDLQVEVNYLQAYKNSVLSELVG